MKKSRFKINRLFLTFVFCCITVGANSQNLESTKATRKEERKVERSINYHDLGISLERRRFTIEMENQLKQNGNKTGMNPLLNFIMVDSLNCVWQSELEDIPSDFFKSVSKVEGRIDNWKLVKNNKNFSYYMQFKMVTDNGWYQASVTINSDKSASGNINNSKFNFSFYGRIVPH
jgi:hypothetical protein